MKTNTFGLPRRVVRWNIRFGLAKTLIWVRTQGDGSWSFTRKFLIFYETHIKRRQI